MSLAGAIREALSPQPRGDELRPTTVLDSIAGVALILSGALYLLFDTFGGMIRATFGAVGLTALIYLPAAVAIPALLVNALSRIGDSRTSVAVLALVGFMVVELILSVMLGRTVQMAVFGLYIWIPGLIMMSLVQRRMQDRLIDLMIPMFFVATAGVLLNSLVTFPWADASYEVMGREMAAAREWSAYGQTRLAGFTRASFLAAGQILIGYCALEHRLTSLVWRAIWWGVGAVAIQLTTSKSPFLAMILLPATYFIVGRIRATGAARRTLLAGLWMAFWLLLIFLGPFLSITYGKQLYPNGTGTGLGYSSLADRVLNTWPNAMAMIDWRDPVSVLVGRGLGGVGSPSTIFAPPGNPGDNLAIYLFLAFGLVSFIFAYLIFRGGQRAIASGSRGRRDFAMIIAMLGIGSAANVIEGVVALMVLGLAISRQVQRRVTAEPDRTGAPQQRRRRRRSRPVDEEATAGT